jgi:hypothetical protein
MKVKICALLASSLTFALMLPIAPAGAAAGTVCKTVSVSSTFSPTLPKIGNNERVNSTVYTKSTLGGCNNGVTGGTWTGRAKLPSANCTTIQNEKPVSSTARITWKPASTGTSTLRLIQSRLPNGNRSLTGTVTAGRFKGTKATIILTVTRSNPGACGTSGLKNLLLKQAATAHI